MTLKDKVDIEKLSDLITEHIENDAKWKKELKEDVDKISRGLYGDQENGVAGVIIDLRNNKKDTETIKNVIWKVSVITGIIVTIGLYIIDKFILG